LISYSFCPPTICRSDSLAGRFFFCSICSETAKTRYDEVAAAISAKEAQSERLVDFIRMLKKQDGSIAEFDERLWGCMVDFVTVSKKKEITVTFRNGSEIQA
jgi:site-specific DNA recombinase